MGLTNALNFKPIRVLGIFTAFHSVVYGVGYLTGRGGFDGALVGLSIQSDLITNVLGVLLLITGLILMYAFIRHNPKTIRALSWSQTIIWFFVSLMYLFNGAYLLSLGVGISWAVVSYYIAFAANNRLSIIEYDLTEQARIDTANEDQL